MIPWLLLVRVSGVVVMEDSLEFTANRLDLLVDETLCLFDAILE